MTIKSSLALVIGLLSILLLGIGSLGMMGLNQTNDSFKGVYEDRAVPLGDLALFGPHAAGASQCGNLAYSRTRKR